VLPVGSSVVPDGSVVDELLVTGPEGFVVSVVSVASVASVVAVVSVAIDSVAEAGPADTSVVPVVFVPVSATLVSVSVSVPLTVAVKEPETTTSSPPQALSVTAAPRPKPRRRRVGESRHGVRRERCIKSQIPGHRLRAIVRRSEPSG